jgi:hypothetical protein
VTLGGALELAGAEVDLQLFLQAALKQVPQQVSGPGDEVFAEARLDLLPPPCNGPFQKVDFSQGFKPPFWVGQSRGAYTLSISGQGNLPGNDTLIPGSGCWRQADVPAMMECDATRQRRTVQGSMERGGIERLGDIARRPRRRISVANLSSEFPLGTAFGHSLEKAKQEPRLTIRFPRIARMASKILAAEKEMLGTRRWQKEASRWQPKLPLG